MAPQAPPPYFQISPGPPPKQSRKALLAVLGTVFGLLGLSAGAVVYHISTRPGPTNLSTAGGTPWQKLADGMTAALSARDEEAFLKPFKGNEVREKQRKVFRNLVKIPWAAAHWETQFAAPLNGDMMVTFVHQVKGVDSKPVPEVYNWRVEPGGTAPVITAVSGSKDLMGKTSDTSYYPAPWDFYNDLAVENRGNLVVVADSGQAAEVKRDADVLAQAAKDDLAAWNKAAPPAPAGRESAPGFFVVLEKRRDVYNKLYAGEGRTNDSLEAGVNMPIPAYDSKDTKQLESGGSRIVMDTTQSRFASADWKEGVSEIGRHEMGHALVEPFGTEQVLVQGLQDTQMWVVEGFAEYMAYRGKSDLARADLKASLQGYRFDGTLPESLDFYSNQGQARAAHYALGASALQYMGQKYGEDKVFAFVAAHYADPKQYQRQITDATGLTLQQFQTDWAAYVRTAAGTP
ncbi:hypothetical protein [Kitasatospora sp. GP82]|uniref:hypothetical protein n=1 Tax=Kitasatospora sp. GP82 TaxID=3035089 RepID=UPI002473DBA3|nr:hypothetical protein [Kitasatospora sp. GP82]